MCVSEPYVEHLKLITLPLNSSAFRVINKNEAVCMGGCVCMRVLACVCFLNKYGISFH